jgi:mannan endo-1,4-beta-mannosidase
MGGNRWTAYNWTTNASNAGNDYISNSDNFLSASTIPGYAVYPTINANIAAGQATLFTVPMQGLVSADEAGPVPTTNAPDLARFQVVVDQKSTVSSAPFTTTPPVVVVSGEDTGNVYSDEFAWAMNQLSTTKAIFSGTTATPAFVDLDNEPELWSSTHLEVQGPTLITPAAYIAKTLTMTEALKTQFPNMIIFGPSHYGFLGVYNFQGGVTGTTPTGENWFPDEYFQALSTASATFGKPLVDVYDFHWYPEDYDAGSTRVTSLTAATLSDADMQLIVQAPRNLWDPTFTDPGNSNPWVNSVLGGAPIEFLPRLQAKINAEFPSIKLSISEYETGGFNNIAGTVAQADQLGVYASNGLFAAMLWPPSGTYDYELAGFRAYRNFDGAGSNFGDTSVSTISSNPGSVMVYVSTDSTTPGRVVLVAINRANTSQVAAITGLSLSGTANLYQMTATTAAGQSPVTPVSIGTMAVSGSSLTLTLPAYSVTTIDVP